jgi:hypothetical protein
MGPSRKNTNLQSIIPDSEFSRKLQPERILKSRRDYSVDLEATDEEREALASRFDLAQIESLHASVALCRESSSAPSSSWNAGIQVRGTVTASVTQTCVRTGEDFQVRLEFPVDALVRPVQPLMLSLSFEEGGQEKAMRETRSSQGSMRNNKKRTSYRTSGESIDTMDVSELQSLLQEAELDDEFDSSTVATLMEDEAIYSTESLFDVGELISQLFWLQLDPYPKKEGSGPVQFSITG